MFTRSLLIFLAIPLQLSAAEPLTFPATPPTEAKDAAKTFHVLDGFEMQLIAAEPLVTDPVAITYDEDGRAYVCEMNDYPYTDKSTHKPSQENPTDANIGKVRLLTDTNGDGVFDKASIFAEGLSWPTGAACWKGGIFVTATPDVWYLKDTNGDGVADVQKKVFTGLKKLNVQAVMNNPIWGLDHRIYIAGGTNGGEIRRAEGSEDVMPLPKDSKPLPIKRNDFSFDPSTGDVRLESGGARFGNTFDDWGNRFLCNIRNPCQHVVIPHRYLERNPYVSIPSPLNDCAEAGDQLPVYRTSPVEPWRDFRAQRWSSEGSHLPKSELVGAGVVTSSAGITIYRDFAFVADVAGNLFYRMKLVPDGVTFKAVQVDGTKNFCTSDDVWFRPVNFTNAPDGCLHVCDMYREVIEHPWSIPDDIHASLDLLKGRNRGRIWRLAPKGHKSKHPPMMSQATTGELVALLDHANGWHRETAQRLLFERQDKTAVEPLRELVKSGKTAQGVIGALWALPELTEKECWDLMHSASEHVREHVFRSAQNQKGIVQKYNSPWGVFDPIVNVRFQAALVLADMSGPVVENSLSQLSRTDGDDPWIRSSILSAAVDQEITILRHLIAPLAIRETYNVNAQQHSGMVNSELIADLVKAVVIQNKQNELSSLIHQILQVEPIKLSDRPNKLIAIARGIKRGGHHFSQVVDPAYSSKLIDSWLAESRRIAIGSHELLAQRLYAIDIISFFDTAKGILDISPRLLVSNEPPELQIHMVEALGSYREPAIADMLIDAWPKMTPALRDKVTTILLSHTDRVSKLLDAIEAKKITPAQLSVAAKATLGRQKTPALAERTAKLIGDSANPNRKAVIEKYQAALTTKGDATRGAKVYEMACMACHRHGSRGIDIGPHLATVKAWTPEQLLTNILDPNREVSPNFALYVIETKDGRTLSGLVMSETAGNVVLKRVDGGQESLLRSDIQSISSTGTSLMPEGVEAAITPEQMADLIEFLRQ